MSTAGSSIKNAVLPERRGFELMRRQAFRGLCFCHTAAEVCATPREPQAKRHAEFPANAKGRYRCPVFAAYVSAGFQPEPADKEEAAKRSARQFGARVLPFLLEDPAAPILELGCGQGRFRKFLFESGYPNLIGVDVSPEQVGLARKLVHSAPVHQANALDYLAYGESVDAIVALDLIEHFTKRRGSAVAEDGISSRQAGRCSNPANPQCHVSDGPALQVRRFCSRDML